MCGVVGIIAFNDKGRIFFKDINLATENLSKRGPDKNGIYSDNNVSLGHTRLSIIDTTEAASQPFTDNSGRYTIIFNGEIFNFKILKENFLDNNIQFKSQSDTEVILKLFIKEGPSFINKLNGFFVFAIYDKLENSILLARDRYGIKPLLYYQDEDKFIFASEMKALLAFDIPKSIDQTALYTYFQLNYIPAPNSIFADINKVIPGSYFVIKNNQVNKYQYYELPYNENKLNTDSYDTCKQQVSELLDDSVKKRLISDVPLGAFLSGGIDSSIIVSLASKYTKDLNTFSIGFKDEEMFDETFYARLVSKRYKTNHREFLLTNDDIFSILFDVLDYTDEPYADSSALAVYILSKETRKHVTVALSGDGADELFGGYNKHSAELKARNQGFAAKILKYSAPLWKELPQSRNSKFTNKIRQINRFIEGINMEPADRYWRWCALMGEKKAAELLKGNFDINEYQRRKHEILKFINENKGLNDVLYTDMNLVLQNDMLTKVDMMSMTNSLEVRVPFLDYRLVDYVFSLPSVYKIDRNSRKKILKDAFRANLPQEIFTRKKHGFEVPLLKWFRNELKSLIIDDLLSDNFIIEQGIFNIDEIRKIKEKLFSNNPGDAHSNVWALIVFQYWWKRTMK